MSALRRPHPIDAPAPQPAAPCRHCQEVRRLGGRRLCGVCFRTPEIRKLYPARLPNVERPGGPCVHCRTLADRLAPRNLCQLCWHDDAIRTLYPGRPERSRGGRGPCRACGTDGRLKRRGLCRSCYYDPATRAAFPSTSARATTASRGLAADSYAVRPLPPTPTAFLPGTEGKIAVLEERARLGLRLFHPLDAGMPAAAEAEGVPAADAGWNPGRHARRGDSRTGRGHPHGG